MQEENIYMHLHINYNIKLTGLHKSSCFSLYNVQQMGFKYIWQLRASLRDSYKLSLN
jgi:hypothetical protein